MIIAKRLGWADQATGFANHMSILRYRADEKNTKTNKYVFIYMVCVGGIGRKATRSSSGWLKIRKIRNPFYPS